MQEELRVFLVKPHLVSGIKNPAGAGFKNTVYGHGKILVAAGKQAIICRTVVKVFINGGHNCIHFAWSVSAAAST